MTRPNLIELLQANQSSLPASWKRLAHFLLTNFDKAVFMTAAELAKQAGTSESTVVRFARGTGYQGFPELREDLQVLLREKLLPTDRIERNDRLSSRSEDVLSRVFGRALTNIRETRKLLDQGSLAKAGQAIVNSRNKHVIGLNASASVAKLLGYYLAKIQPNVMLHTVGGPPFFDALAGITAADSLIALSFPLYAKWTVEALRYTRQLGATAIAITDSPLSPAGQVAEIALIARADSVTIGSSYVVPMLLVDALVSAILNIDRQSALSRLQTIQELNKGQGFFYLG